MTYEENVRLKAEGLLKIKFGPAWDHLDKEDKQEEIELALPQAAKALEWAAEIAHAVNGPQFSKHAVDSMLVVLGVIPRIRYTPEIPESKK